MTNVSLGALAPAVPIQPRTAGRAKSVPIPPLPKALRNPVFLASLLCAATGTTWSAVSHSMLLYADAQSHLNVARHVTDGLRPGLAQLGSVWLPLPHIMLAPLVAFDWMWHSGAAGATVGGCCFVYSSVRMYSLVDELTGSRVGAWCAFAVYSLNLNLLYLQSTALTEPVLLAFLVGTAYHLARWFRTRGVRELAIAALLTFCATLTRYDGWALLAAAAVAVVVWTWLDRRHAKEVEANVLTFVAIAGYGVALWILYNLIIFHNALYFIQSSYSSQSQQNALSHVGMLTTRGHPLQSAATYGWTVVDVLGPAVALATAFCVIGLGVARKPGRRRTLFTLGVLAAPVVFNVLSLWLGQTTVRVPQVSPHGMWNVRYGLVALPLAAVALGVVAGRWRKLAPLVAAVPAAGLVLMALSTPVTLKDGRVGISSAATERPLLAAAYLRRHYHGGEVLADDSLASPFMFESGLDLKQFVTVGFEPWYVDALRSPASTVAWLVVVNSDAVSADMAAHPDRFRDFTLALTDVMPHGVIRIYRR